MEGITDNSLEVVKGREVWGSEVRWKNKIAC
jgi:hypothetical protein